MTAPIMRIGFFLMITLVMPPQVKAQQDVSKKTLIDDSVNSICECMTQAGGTGKDFKKCISLEVPKHKEEIRSAYGNINFSSVSKFIVDVTFQSIDQCPKVSAVLFKGRASSYKTVEKCSTPIVGIYSYDLEGFSSDIAYVKFTTKSYEELDKTTMKVTESLPITWKNCMGTAVFQSDGAFTKKGDVMKVEIRRESPEGFLALLTVDGVESITEYRKK